MKITTIISILPFLFTFSTILNAQNVVIPDANFKTILIANTTINTNGDSEIQLSEAQAFSGTLSIQNKNISDLTGIAAFTNLTKLTCYGNMLTSLDLSNNTALKFLDCSFNPLTSVNFGTNPMDFIMCDGTSLTSLDISNLPIDSFIFRHNDHINTFTTGNNTTLTYLDLNDNRLSSVDVSNNTSLKTLRVYVNQIQNLDISTLSQLIHLDVSLNQLTTLDVSNNPLLEYLSCGANSISTLDLSSNPLLKKLYVDYNSLTSLDLSNNIALEAIDVTNNQLTALDFSAHTNLARVGCMANSLTTLDLSNNPNLILLNCNTNQLTMLNLKNGNNHNVISLDARNNNLSCIEVDNANYSIANWAQVDNHNLFSNACLTNIHKVPSKSLNVNAFPNPTSNKITLDLQNSQEDIHVVVSNALGQITHQQSYSPSASIDLNIEGANGIYLIKVTSNQQEKLIKVIKH